MYVSREEHEAMQGLLEKVTKENEHIRNMCNKLAHENEVYKELFSEFYNKLGAMRMEQTVSVITDKANIHVASLVHKLAEKCWLQENGIIKP